MKRNIFLLALLMFSNYCISQKKYEKGYIITSKNDTVVGEIRDNMNRLSGLKPIVRFKVNENKTINYKAKKIKGYGFFNGKNYLSVNTPYGFGYGEILIDGTLRLVLIEMYGGSTGDGMPNCIYRAHKIYKEGKEVFEVPEADDEFRAKVSEFFSDYPELQQGILDLKLRKQHIGFIVEMYNKWSKNDLRQL